MSEILFWTVGDRQHGMGHVIRCLTLANELRRRGHGILFATEHETPGLARIRQAGYPVYDFAPTDLSWTRRFATDMIILDIEDGPPRQILEEARAHHARLVVIGGSGYIMRDQQAIQELADLFVCQTVLPTDGDLMGPEHIIIDPAFAECTPNPEGHILVSFGGGDPHGLMPRAIDVLRGLGRTLIVVNGPASDIVTQYHDNIISRHAPASLVPVMDGAALFVGALGMSAYEAAAAGVPAILTAWSQDHANIAFELERLGCAISIGVWDCFDPDDTAEKAQVLILDDEEQWNIMSAAGKALVDGKGAARVVDAIERLLLNGTSM